MYKFKIYYEDEFGKLHSKTVEADGEYYAESLFSLEYPYYKIVRIEKKEK